MMEYILRIVIELAVRQAEELDYSEERLIPDRCCIAHKRGSKGSCVEYTFSLEWLCL